MLAGFTRFNSKATWTLGLLFLAIGCGPDATAPSGLGPISLSVVSGNGQSGVVGSELPQPLAIKATDSRGVVQGGLTVNFRVTSGGGSVYAGTAATDSKGIAEDYWTLGTSTAPAQTQRVEVRAVLSSGQKQVYGVFTATALPGPAAQIAIGAGNQQSAHPASTVPIAPAVRVTDQYGNPVPNVTVTFTPAAGSGSVTSGTPKTDANGTATVGSWTLGSTCPSTNTLTATATGNGIAGNPATFTARAGDCWTTLTSMPTAQLSMGFAANNGILYSFGGANGNNAVDADVEAYDPATDTWTTKTPMPTAGNLLGAAAVNGILYAIGGINGGSIRAEVEAYDPATDSWTTKTPMPTGQFELGVAAINGIIYAVGGEDAGGISATVQAYDPATGTWTTKASMPTARRFLGVGVVNGLLYAIGGQDASLGTVATVEAYDPTTNAWTTKTSMPTARWGLGVAAINGIIYAVGGTSHDDAGQFLATVEAYDPATDTWTTKASMPTAVERLGTAAANGILYAVGGYNGTHLATNQAYHP